MTGMAKRIWGRGVQMVVRTGVFSMSKRRDMGMVCGVIFAAVLVERKGFWGMDCSATGFGCGWLGNVVVVIQNGVNQKVAKVV